MKKYLFATLFVITTLPALETHDSGVSEEVINLPEGPATISGMGSANLTASNQGDFRYSIKIDTPKGINGRDLGLALRYSSASGNGALGYGWSFSDHEIKRDSARGIDIFHSETFLTPQGKIVKIEGLDEYVPVNNSSQSRYFLTNGDWEVWHGDGSKEYYTSDYGIDVDRGVYSWKIESKEDSNGNKITYHYVSHNGYDYLSEIRYAYVDTTSYFKVVINYEDRSDIRLIHKYGEPLEISKRIDSIEVRSGSGTLIRKYQLGYQGSHLDSVKLYGLNGADTTPASPTSRFSYTGMKELTSLSAESISFSGDLPPGLKDSKSVFIDVNLDSLPDIVQTSRSGARVWINQGGGSFAGSTSYPSFLSTLGGKNSKLLDVDGDRVVDFVGTGLYPHYYRGGVNGFFDSNATPIGSIPKLSLSASNVKLVDLNDDGRIDILARDADHFKSYISDGAGSWAKSSQYQIATHGVDISSRLSFITDFDGDSASDLVFLARNGAYYLASLGNGQFETPQEISFSDETILELAYRYKNSYVSDINGDGLADITVINQNSIWISFNQSNLTMGDIHHIDLNLNGFDNRGVMISFADINGNGTSDIVWSNYYGDYRYVDFYETKGNLLNKIENGLGLETVVEYKQHTAFMDIEGLDATELHFPQIVVSKITKNKVGESSYLENRYSYHNGFHDAFENRFKGFEMTKVVELGDDFTKDRLVEQRFYQGRTLNQRPLEGTKREDGIYSTNASLEKEYLLTGNSYDYTVLTQETVVNGEASGYPLLDEQINTEGDTNSSTSDRSHKVIYSYQLDSNNYIEVITKSTYSDLTTLYKKEITTLAIEDVANNYVLNRPCEVELQDSSSVTLKNERYFYDSLSSHCYVTKGNPTKKSIYDGASYETKREYGYNSRGQLTSFKDSFGRTTTIGYGSNGIYPETVTNPLNHIKSASYDYSIGKISSMTDDNSNQFSYTYDIFHRIKKIVGPDDTLALPMTEYSYSFGTSTGTPSEVETVQRVLSGESATERTISFIDYRGNSVGTLKIGDSSNLLTKGTNFNRNNKEVEIFNNFTTSGESLPNFTGYKAQVLLDELERPLYEYNPQHLTSDPSFRQHLYEVGKDTHYDEMSKISIEYMDIFGRRTISEDHDSNSVQYAYTEFDKIKTIQAPNGEITSIEYDMQLRRSCKSDPNVGVMVYSYNSEDLVTQLDDYGFDPLHNDCDDHAATSRTTLFEYNDLLNRRTKIDYPVGSNTPDIILGYDSASSSNAVGKLTSVSVDSVLSKIFHYDKHQNKSRTIWSIDSESYDLQESYDLKKRIESISYPTTASVAGMSVEYHRNSLGQITQIDDVTNFRILTSNISYNSQELPTSYDYLNGVNTTLSYKSDGSFFLEGIEVNSSKKSFVDQAIAFFTGERTTLVDLQYAHNEVANITERRDTLVSDVEGFSYDNLHRMNAYDLNGTYSRTWTFDDIGNISTKAINLTTQTYNYNTDRKQIISSIDSTNYTTDAYGNITDDGERTLTYNFNNMPITVTKNSQTYTSYYDEKNIRAKKVTLIETRFFIDKYLEISDNEVIRHLFWNDMRIGAVDSSNVVVFNHEDHQGSSVLKTDASGSSVKNKSYYPFGETRASSGSYDKTRNNYTSQYEDVESGLYYYKRRYYNPVLGRFLSADPLYAEEIDERGENTQKINLYAYVGNNPLNMIDPSGESNWELNGRFNPPSDQPPLNAAVGVSFEVSSINPFTSGGGGSYGINFEYISGQGLGAYKFYTPSDVNSVGFSPSASVTFNMALGQGSWTGPFENNTASFGTFTMGTFNSPNSSGEVGYVGFQVGGSLGARAGVGNTTTIYENWSPSGSYETSSPFSCPSNGQGDLK